MKLRDHAFGNVLREKSNILCEVKFRYGSMVITVITVGISSSSNMPDAGEMAPGFSLQNMDLMC